MRQIPSPFILQGAILIAALILLHDHAALASQIKINRQDNHALCSLFQGLLKEPVNSGYLVPLKTAVGYPESKLASLTMSGRQLIIPEKKRYSSLLEPSWKNVPIEEAKRLFPKLIDDQRRIGKWVIGKDYNLQVTHLDLKGKGKTDALYRAIGKGYNSLEMDEESDDTVARYLYSHRFQVSPGQVFLYRGKPYFAHRSLLSVLLVSDLYFSSETTVVIASRCELSAE